MAISRAQKEAVVAEVSGDLERLDAAGAAVLAEFRGLSVAQMTVLRRAARNEGVKLRVVKNTLTKRIVTQAAAGKFAALGEHVDGSLALASAADAVAVAKVLNEFAKGHDSLRIKAGVMDGRLLDAAAIKALAALPSREQLLATLLVAMRAPLQKFVSTLQAVPLKAVRTLAAVRDAKDGGYTAESGESTVKDGESTVKNAGSTVEDGDSSSADGDRGAENGAPAAAGGKNT